MVECSNVRLAYTYNNNSNNNSSNTINNNNITSIELKFTDLTTRTFPPPPRPPVPPPPPPPVVWFRFCSDVKSNNRDIS